MKIKAKLTQTVGWNEIAGNENVVVDTVLDKVFNNFSDQQTMFCCGV